MRIAPNTKVNPRIFGQKRTRRHMRQKYGTFVPQRKSTVFDYIKAIGLLIALGLLILGILYWIFG